MCQANTTLVHRAFEHNRRVPRGQYGEPLARMQNSCPHMDVVDYAAFKGPHYVGIYGDDMDTFASDRRQTQTRTLANSLKNIQSPLMTVFFTETLSLGGLECLWRSVLGELGPLPRLGTINTNNDSQTPRDLSANEAMALQHILAHDINVYLSARARSCENVVLDAAVG